MRADTQQAILQADPGQTLDITVEVVNTSELIDGVSASLSGLPGAVVTAEPALLPLFPDARGQIRLRVEVPDLASLSKLLARIERLKNVVSAVRITE